MTNSNLGFLNNQQTLFACGRSATRASSPVEITVKNGSLRVKSPYSATFVEQLKVEIPATARVWDKTDKVWLVAPSYGPELKRLCERVYGGTVTIPDVPAQIVEVAETTIEIEYLGNCRNNVASAHSGGLWSVKFPETVLRAFFKQTEQNAGTLYALLGCDEKATAQEIKQGYRRAALAWHPDQCREENARERFEEIKRAYDILSNVESRNRYNAGLIFEKLAKMTPKASRFATFVPPFRCGRVKLRGRYELGQLIVEEILEWGDIVNAYGQTMVSYWDGDTFSVMWV